MADLAVTRVEHWVYRFVVMLTLSVIVAVMGLSLDSAAVVIGAMLLAPLMQPVLAAGACLSMALFTKSVVALAKVAAATAWAIGIAWVISWILPEQELTSEVLSRTAPDLKDLIVALAAGTAGAYATVRSDVSSSLPGVAVAVALVPPLASVGIALEVGEQTLAFGAFLLYLTNLAAIVFASIVVFVITGFVPHRRLSENLLRLSLATVILSGVVIAIAVPLYRQSIESIQAQDDARTADAVVAGWLGDLARTMSWDTTVDRHAKRVVVEVRGLDQPPPEGALIDAMRQEFEGYDVPVQWIRTQRATTTTIPPPEPTEQLVAAIRAEVDAWLAEAGMDYQVDRVLLDGTVARIDAAGTGEPPPINLLLPRLQAIDPALTPRLNWARLERITEDSIPTPLELTSADMGIVVEQWAAERDLLVTQFGFDGQRVDIDVLGADEPDFARLERTLREIAGEEVPIRVFFTRRQLVTTTLPPVVTVAPR